MEACDIHDTGRITIDKCAFYNASGTAIRLRQGSNSTQVSIRDGVFIGWYCLESGKPGAWREIYPK